MDVCAVANASDKFLEELGLTKAGDRLNLVAYCKSLDINASGSANMTSSEESNRKRRVPLKHFCPGKSQRKHHEKTPTTHEVSLQQDKQMNKIKTKKITLGWKHFREEGDSYVLIPLAKGGGSRTVEVPVNNSRTELMKICKDLFYPNERSIFGASHEMFEDLSNFKDEKINESIRIGDRIMSFNISNYMDAYKLQTVRIYFRTKKISIDLDSDGEIKDGPVDSMFLVSELGCLISETLVIVHEAKLLGVILRSDLRWNSHVYHIISKCSKRLYLLIQLKRANVKKKDIMQFYKSCIRSVLEYASTVFHQSLPKYLSDEIEQIQRRAMSIIYPDLS